MLLLLLALSFFRHATPLQDRREKRRDETRRDKKEETTIESCNVTNLIQSDDLERGTWIRPLAPPAASALLLASVARALGVPRRDLPRDLSGLRLASYTKCHMLSIVSGAFPRYIWPDSSRYSRRFIRARIVSSPASIRKEYILKTSPRVRDRQPRRLLASRRIEIVKGTSRLGRLN